MFTWFKHRAIDRELSQILDENERVRGDAAIIRDFLLRVLADNRNGIEKFSDEVLEEAAEIIEQVGPGAFYWMTDIAAQMVTLSEATLPGFSTNVSVELGATATEDSIVEMVVRLP
jgi:malate/lactate dehydrogenase